MIPSEWPSEWLGSSESSLWVECEIRGSWIASWFGTRSFSSLTSWPTNRIFNNWDTPLLLELRLYGWIIWTLSTPCNQSLCMGLRDITFELKNCSVTLIPPAHWQRVSRLAEAFSTFAVITEFDLRPCSNPFKSYFIVTGVSHQPILFELECQNSQASIFFKFFLDLIFHLVRYKKLIFFGPVTSGIDPKPLPHRLWINFNFPRSRHFHRNSFFVFLYMSYF